MVLGAAHTRTTSAEDVSRMESAPAEAKEVEPALSRTKPAATLSTQVRAVSRQSSTSQVCEGVTQWVRVRVDVEAGAWRCVLQR
jgi:hypothetical protein